MKSNFDENYYTTSFAFAPIGGQMANSSDEANLSDTVLLETSKSSDRGCEHFLTSSNTESTPNSTSEQKSPDKEQKNWTV